MWQGDWRDKIWAELEQPWDIIVIGGGITGAGILREASRSGLKALMVEQRDFSWGTSSRSSKLVHGGLRYLQQGKPLLTRSLVQERNRLLNEAPGLVEPLGFLLVSYRGDLLSQWIYSLGLSIYDLMELRWRHRYYSPWDFQMLAPRIAQDILKGGFRYWDARTDDSRLVLRVIREAVAGGATALSYASAKRLIREKDQVLGILLQDKEKDRTAEVRAKVVINATGTWADRLRQQMGREKRIRPLRGSHLIFPNWRLPVAQAVTFAHPLDRRHIYVLPWEGVSLVGTTDMDHDRPLEEEPAISPKEAAYLMAGLQAVYPSLDLALEDVISTYAGVRAVVGTGKANPSKESRDHVVWEEDGLLTVTGGKLTDFRLIALDALNAVRHRFPTLPPLSKDVPVISPVDVDLPDAEHLDEATRSRLLGRFGADAPAVVALAASGELEPIPGTETVWAELRWAARSEGVVHLEDLMLRRVRLGVLLPQGGMAVMERIRSICQTELGWEDARWEEEEAAYMDLWRGFYSPPSPSTVPDWRKLLSEARPTDKVVKLIRRRESTRVSPEKRRG